MSEGKEVTVRQSQELSTFSKKEVDLIRDTVAKDLTTEEMALFLYTSNERGLNPLLRQIYAIKRSQKQSDGTKKDVMTIQTGIDGFRLLAERTRTYAPSPKPTFYEYRNNRLFSATVFGMKLVVGQWIEFSATAITDEYRVDTNPIWQKMLHSQTEKCAEAKMLRRGWPEQFGGLYIHEEMQQADAGTTTVLSASLPKPQAPALLPDESQIERCPVHDVPWRTFTGKGGSSWQAHRNDDGTFCNKSKIEVPKPDASKDTTPVEKTPVEASKEPNKLTQEDVVKMAYSKYEIEDGPVLGILKKGNPNLTKLEEVKNWNAAWEFLKKELD